MGELDLSDRIPAEALWLKVHYEMKPLKEGAELNARIWSGEIDEAVVLKGASGDAFIKLGVPQRLWYQRPVTVELKLKLIAYKVAAE